MTVNTYWTIPTSLAAINEQYYQILSYLRDCKDAGRSLDFGDVLQGLGAGMLCTVLMPLQILGLISGAMKGTGTFISLSDDIDINLTMSPARRWRITDEGLACLAEHEACAER